MTLSQLLAGVPVAKMFQTMYGQMVVTHEVEVTGIQYDSRLVSRGNLFVAIKGAHADGHAYISAAVTNGAKVVVLENDGALPDSYFMHAGVVKVVTEDSRKALAIMAANYYRHPSQKLRVIGVTGTNGKTSTTYLIKSILEATGDKVGLIGTIHYMIGDEIVPSTHTTPESLELQQLLATMADKGCTSVVMEVSSHSLAMSRVHGIKFAAATFTNLTQDHLDFHGTMEKYFAAKKSLFDNLEPGAASIVNADDPFGASITTDARSQTYTYSIGNSADVVASDISLALSGTTFKVQHKDETFTVGSTLIGRFNVQNILAAFSTALALGVDPQSIGKGVASLHSVPGRFQQFASPAGWIVVVDYAHTHDAMENCLRAIHDILPLEKKGKVITVFGAGGDRDKTKRPKMGRVAAQYSDTIVLTSDNPRSEDPLDIIEEIRAGIPEGKEVFVDPDRRSAIAKALAMALHNDVVLLAGKGHETYQVIGDKKIHFDDREEVENFIRTIQ